MRRILGIETSCDDTCLAIVDTSKRILHSSIHRSLGLNERYGGIHPVVARRSHQDNINRLIDETSPFHNQVDLVAVTTGPGMRASLHVGVDAAIDLARRLRVPVIGVHHMQAHALTPRLLQDLSFPFMTLLVSGGHTLLLNSCAVDDHRIIANTVDIAIGDYLDKVAKDLHVPWHGQMPGAALERWSQPGRKFGLSRPLRAKVNILGQRHERMAFSFTGLGSILPRILAQNISEEDKKALGSEAMTVAFDHLVQKVVAGLEQYPSQALVMSGGVARNQQLRSMMQSAIGKIGLSD